MRKILFLVAIFAISGPAMAATKLASTDYVDGLTGEMVKTTTDQDIGGEKNFTTSPVVPTPPLPQSL